MATEKAIFAGGCFWCTEAVFLMIKGVAKVRSGYIGGARPNPTYEQVCSGVTGHAEAVEIAFDPAQVSYDALLDVFFATHDPRQLNRQGNDIGTQYRSGVFTLSEAQKAAAQAAIARATKLWDGKIVTEVTPAGPFYVAEDYHQDFFANNPTQGYCRAIVAPKVAKARAKFKDLLKA
ncbi:MAG: peptide-methionine (S)-S-oxide reductase MsrA [Alphaproteobacteria bacterium]|nr:peptide-methionine (S)-S-oxide reductase MsrA [Alphaproteobacteria bacterium]